MNRSRISPPALAMFEPIDWIGHYEPRRYIAHLYRELGRLGLDTHDIERYDRTSSQSVLSDVCEWMTYQGNEANLYDWQRLNLELLFERASKCEYTRIKPRIQVSAHITARGNLSVLWYPVGWRDNYWDADRKRKASDFLFFESEGGSFERPNNELMFIHGVSDLRPDRGINDYGPYLRYNKPVVDAILVCVLRSAYESLIERLQHTFEVTVRTVFIFKKNERQVIAWSLADPEVLQHQRDQAELAAIEENFGFTLELFDEQLRLASLPTEGSEEVPGDYRINQKLAKQLTKAGQKITPSRVEHLRHLINRYRTYTDRD